MPEAVTVVIPAFNEEAAIGEVVNQIAAKLTACGVPFEVLVVDDGSTDRTGSVAAAHGATLVPHYENMGYGRSLKDGIVAAAHDLIAITDADGTYPAERLPDLVGHAGASTWSLVAGRAGNTTAVRQSAWLDGVLRSS